MCDKLQAEKFSSFQEKFIVSKIIYVRNRLYFPFESCLCITFVDQLPLKFLEFS